MDWSSCPIKFLIWGEMDLDPGSWGGLELGLKIGAREDLYFPALPSTN